MSALDYTLDLQKALKYLYQFFLFIIFTSEALTDTAEDGSLVNRLEFSPSSAADAKCNAIEKIVADFDKAIPLLEQAKYDYMQKTCSKAALPRDCEDVFLSGQKKSGVYKIWPNSRVTEGCSVDVYCDMETDGGGWTVIQRRGDFGRPTNYFNQDWDTYKKGFGYIEKDFWLGNDNIFALTGQKSYSVRFDLKDKGNRAYALYDTFWIDDEYNFYTLHIKGYSGNAGDSMTELHNNRKFSTKDRKNDRHPTQSCSTKYIGGWWYSGCFTPNLNGLYYTGVPLSQDGVQWYAWKGYHASIEESEIKIRSKDFGYPTVFKNWNFCSLK